MGVSLPLDEADDMKKAFGEAGNVVSASII